MNSQWTLIALVLAAGLITAMAAVALKAGSKTAQMLVDHPNYKHSFSQGLLAGLLVWPLSLLALFRISDRFYEWVINGPFPLNYMQSPFALLAFTVIFAGVPLAISLILHKREEASEANDKNEI